MTKAEFTNSEYQKISDICMLAETFPCFKFEGLLVEGDIVKRAKEFVSESPSKKFRTWIIDRKYVIKEL